MPAPKKLVLAVIDAMKPAMLERAVASGRAPALALLVLAALAWLLAGGRRRAGEKYAGLRILR